MRGQALLDCRRLRLPEVPDSRHKKVVSLSSLSTGRLYPLGNIPSNHFCWKLIRSQGHGAAGKILSMNNSSDIIGNRTRGLPACSEVLQPIASLI